jgi:ribosomal protein L11 methyltransferase
LGYRPISAFDLDPDAVRVAAENARRNGVRRRILLRRFDLKRFKPPPRSRRFDVLCANLTFDLLLAERRRILACLAPRGRLVLAGILRQQFVGVRRAFEEAGLLLIASQLEGEWKSGAFVRRMGD